MINRLLLLLHLIGALTLLLVNAKTYETDDAIIVEVDAEDTTQTESRSKRDINIVLRDITHNPVTTWGNQFGEGGVCITAKATFGKCTSFKACYPYFKKVPNLSVFDTWVLGQYDTCTYYTGDGRQAFGVCCIDQPQTSGIASIVPENGPIASITPVKEDDNIIVGNKDSTNWPPPFITHPPNHAAPTHAPTGSWPNGGPPSTTKRPIWPPPLPTHPPSGSAIPTTKYPTITTKPPLNDMPVGNYCGSKNGNQDQERIVGGHDASLNEWPWIVPLFNNGRQFCGGSLIDNQHILTAAHCVAHMTSSDVSRMTVHLGDHNIRTTYETQHQVKRVKRVVRHRSFDSRTLYNDVALLTLESPVQYTRNVRPICLPRSGDQFGGNYGTVIGWGSVRENGPQPSVLQKVSVPIWSNAVCRQKYGGAAPGGIIDSMICAGKDARDSCSGDSGGPLMVMNGHTWYQIGVVSWGIGCGQGRYPGVYSRVSSFLPWITKNLATK
ncbi:proclotting enzyme-like [Contarinia nasturtii]|uniref:proclotting enzyme-like n=1 Tax=Contarinia nasturtii TaxID=265458 RepID=UPI0012D3FFF1|nr:proclotting enzyme-like [Contarinia nasturtii]XP_031616964.1 proclotting enzyme-like [Contarinia nasturtii]XP_031616965.1 proclotting enzyme-like [Contarinia nasturtii]XP_031616966.1 proclotting enzyme-like [Contarinia nasturtii]XP_031616967.1 proclotting enzyme-like [Contarinia nasturtii]XP_031616968.1 proclotting enzyme-like [Contarinia nasturtii]